jgi:hypothetical protein
MQGLIMILRVLHRHLTWCDELVDILSALGEFLYVCSEKNPRDPLRSSGQAARLQDYQLSTWVVKYSTE